MNFQIENKIKNQNGQTFIEFIFLLIVVMVLSFGLIRGFNSYTGLRWETFLKIIAIPNSNDVNIP